jgi:CNT family concentrative nucleoside transporter
LGRFTGILGILAVLLAAWLFSTDRRHIRWRTIAWGLGLQITFAFIVLRSDWGSRFMTWAGGVVTNMLSATFAGTQVLFGQLGLPNSGAFGDLLNKVPGHTVNPGAIFAFQVLPTIIFISAFFAVLYHIGLMQIIIRGMAWIMLKTMRISGAESMNVAASIFMGQTEAPLTIRPFLSKATRSELMTIMTSGMAHVSGGIMAMYIAQGVEARHLLSAVIMTSPGTILLAKMMVPETEVPATEGKVVIPKDELHADENFIGAIARGTIDGGKLALNVAIMLISFLALVALLDMMLGWVHGLSYMHWVPPGLGLILGILFRPVAWVIGVPWQDCGAIGTLLGTRMALNEVIAYISLGAQKATLLPRSFTIATFALCGFANLGSIGMQIGGIGALVPERRNDLARLGVRAMLAGTMANLISASIAGIFLG